MTATPRTLRHRNRTAKRSKATAKQAIATATRNSLQDELARIRTENQHLQGEINSLRERLDEMLQQWGLQVHAKPYAPIAFPPMPDVPQVLPPPLLAQIANAATPAQLGISEEEAGARLDSDDVAEAELLVSGWAVGGTIVTI